jgi:CRISPR-associated protein Cas1
MLTTPDFMARKVIIVFPKNGDKIAIKNDNFVVYDSINKIKMQVSCYKIFAVFVVGGFSVTTGVIEKSKKFGFSIVFFTTTFRVYETINFKMEGNTLLRKKQYNTTISTEIARQIIINKIENQRDTLKLLRDINNTEGIMILNNNIEKLIRGKFDNYEIMGIEGTSAKVYFNRMFKEFEWNGRQPRVKRDKINLLLDIGYTILFNYIEAILNIYGFDIYKGNLHQEFYKRKSLVCDMIEPFRTIVDYKIRKSFNLGCFNQYEFHTDNGQYSLNWNDSASFLQIILEEIILYRKCIFEYIQKYYRWFMKEKDIMEFPKVRLEKNDIN